ncbi:MAG: adenosine deaminase [Lachnospiraceae bacterium]
MTVNELKKLPKVELHCHLDGSLSKEFIETRLGKAVSQEELSVTKDCGSLVEYLEKFELPGLCLKDEAGLEGAGYDVLKVMSKENVCYAEIRFAPLLSVTEEMGTEQVIAALLKGLEKGKKDFGVEYNVITCAMRHHSEEQNYQMIKTARQFLGFGVCATDLAGAEAQYPMSEFMKLFQKTKKLGMPFTIHAGECGNVQNIIDAIQVGAGRIGHGIAMRGNSAVQKMVREAHIGIEMCPISNLQTKAVGSVAEYPIREFLDAGVLITVNTDNRTVSNSSMTKELEFIQKMYGVSDNEILILMRNAIDAAFAEDSVKNRLYRKMSDARQ